MDAAPILDAIVERCAGASVEAIGSLPTGLLGAGAYEGQDAEARSIASLFRPQFSASLVSSTLLNGANVDRARYRLTVEVTTTYHYAEPTKLSERIRRSLLSLAQSVASLVSHALVGRGGLTTAANGRATLIASGCCAREVSSQLSRSAPKGDVAIEWSQRFELIAEAMVPAGPVFSVEGFSDSNYWQGQTHFGGNPLGTKRFVLRVTGNADAGFVFSHANAWDVAAMTDGLGFYVTSFTTIYVAQFDAKWTWPTEMVGGLIVAHCVCDDTTEALYVGGCLVSNVIAIDATPTEQSGEVITIGRYAAFSGLASNAFGVCQFEFTDDVMSAAEIARDAALCMSSAAQRARFPALHGSTLAFDARDASGSTWACQRNPSHVLEKHGSPTWRPV